MRQLDPDRMVFGGWTPACVAWLLSEKLAKLWAQAVRVEEGPGTQTVTLTMENGQEFTLTVEEVVREKASHRKPAACKAGGAKP